MSKQEGNLKQHIGRASKNDVELIASIVSDIPLLKEKIFRLIEKNLKIKSGFTETDAEKRRKDSKDRETL